MSKTIEQVREELLEKWKLPKMGKGKTPARYIRGYENSIACGYQPPPVSEKRYAVAQAYEASMHCRTIDEFVLWKLANGGAQ